MKFIQRLLMLTFLLSISNAASSQPLTPADIVGPDGVVYPNWRCAGVENGIPNNPVKAVLSKFGGLPDDGLDDADAMEKAMQTVGETGGGAILLDKGVYHLRRPVVCFHDKVVIRGRGPELTHIIFDYLPEGKVSFFRPQPGSTIHSGSWVEIHARPEGLKALSIDVDGVRAVSRSKQAHWGGTYSLRTSGRNLMRKDKTGMHELRAVAEYENGETARATMTVQFSTASDRPGAVYLPRYLGALTFTGQYPSSKRYRLTEDAKRGEVKIKLEDTKGLNAGDIIVIEAPKTERWDRLVKNACKWGSYRCNEYRITSIENNEITINEPLRIPFPKIDGSYISLLRPIQYCGVERLSISQTQELWTSGVVFTYAWNCWAREVNVKKAGRWPVYTTPGKHCEIRDCYFEDAWYHGGGGTAYTGFERAYDCLMENVRTKKMRHAPCVQWSASGNVIRNSTFTQSDGQWHAGWTNENLFENCTIDAERGTGSYGHGFWASPPEDQAHGPNGPRNVVWGCDVSAPRSGLWMGGMNQGWLILYNRFVCGEGPGVFMKTNSDNHLVSQNVFILQNEKSNAFVIQTGDCDGVRITDNIILGGNESLSAGKGQPAVFERNRHFGDRDRTRAQKPQKPVPSIFAWQKSLQ